MGGVANCSGMFFWVYSTQHAKSTLVALLRYIGVFYSFLIDMIVFKESFSFLQICGACIVLTTNITVIYHKWKLDKSKPSTEAIEILNPQMSELEILSPH